MKLRSRHRQQRKEVKALTPSNFTVEDALAFMRKVRLGEL
jgi:hypothetical protein